MKPEDWERMSQTYEILEWCKEAPKVEDHIAVWVRPKEKVSSPKHPL